MYQGALILEGGGFRGVYTAGVLDYLMDQNIQFSDVYGISAGACNALNYLSQNRGRYIKVAKEYCNDPRYMGIKQLVKTGSIFNWQFSFYESAKNMCCLTMIPFMLHRCTSGLEQPTVRAETVTGSPIRMGTICFAAVLHPVRCLFCR